MQIARLDGRGYNSANQRVIGLFNIAKDCFMLSAPVEHLVNAIDPGSNLPLGELFFSLFQISDHIRKAFIFNKHEENNQKQLKIRYRVGLE